MFKARLSWLTTWTSLCLIVRRSPAGRCILGSLLFKQWMPESLTQIQHDTCKINRFIVNMLLIFICVVVWLPTATQVAKCYLERKRRYMWKQGLKDAMWVAWVGSWGEKIQAQMNQLRWCPWGNRSESHWCIFSLQLITSGELDAGH